MQILKAYSGLGNGLPQPGQLQHAEERDARQQKAPEAQGDTVNLSLEAREALEGRGLPLSAQAADATYDQYGNVTRQFDSLQGELRNLASSLLAQGAGASGHISQLQSQLRALRAMV